jgi:hypothetical protein
MKFRPNICKITGSIACGIVLIQFTGMVQVFAQTNSASAQKFLASPPPLPVPKPPIEYFRELLAMPSAEREKLLADKTPEQKKILLSKFKEYEAMDAEKRELKLKVTELRWYLALLMKVAPADRAEWLATIPEEKRALVEERLQLWDELSAPQQKEFWDNEMAINYFLRLQSSTPEQQTDIFQNVSPATREKLDKELAQWRSLPVEERDRMCHRFQQFFDLNSVEKEKTLGTLSEAERIQMEKTLQTFQNLAPDQRRHCIESFRKFARMDASERNLFLKKAELWQKMSLEDRKAWRDLVQKLPQLPPLPPGLKILPPFPPAPRTVNPLMATNSPR